ncbi:MAG: serine hydrolase [Rhodothermales bacterium]|nr:serine hydrolase [Rhodothermales bacterium]MBO6780517.1 serine hydrolase [Rhodothermales bacterium]
MRLGIAACGLILLCGALRPAAAQHPDFDAVVERARELAPMNSLIIWHRDSLVVESYFRGMARDRRANIKSASKTVLSALVGMAVADGDIPSLDTPLAELLPDYFDDVPEEKRDITLRHAITMRTGLETTSFRNYGAWASSRDWVRFQVDQPMECRPGGCWSYSTGTSHLVGVVLARATGESLLAYARRKLFEPLGVRLAPWDRDPQGNYLGGNNMQLRPLDLAQFGRLFLANGRWQGEQLVQASWIEESWDRYGRSPWNGNGYGFYWWNRRIAGESAWFAWGYGGQFVFVVPRLDLVIATTASLVNRPRGVNHNNAVYRFLGQYVIPTVRERGPSYTAPAR